MKNTEERSRREHRTQTRAALIINFIVGILLVITFLTGCDAISRQYVRPPKDTPYLIITRAELSPKYYENVLGKYQYESRDRYNSVFIYLDELLSVGDTIWISSNRNTITK